MSDDKNKKFQDNKLKYIGAYIAIVLLLIFVANTLISQGTTLEVKYSEFESLGEQGKIKEVKISGTKMFIELKDEFKVDKYKDKELYTERVYDLYLIDKLNKWDIEQYSGVSQETNPIMDFFLNWVLPITVFMVIGRILMGSMQKRMGGDAMSFGKNTAKIYAENETGITFENVAGQEEAKESLQEIVEFLHSPDRFTKIGAKLPKGALLVGPPGTGKTLLAKAVAGEANVTFFSISGSDFVQMFVGMGAARVRDLFAQAQKKAPCIVFIDEIDAIGKSRDSVVGGGGNDEREQTLNQLLTEMDGFDSSKGVVLLGATNRPEILDKALLRPGRFDRRVIVDRPDLIGREAILKVHSKDVKMREDVDLSSIAKGTPGAVGADLANMINEAALRAVKMGREEVIQEDLEEAIEVIIAGKEKKDRIMSDKEKKSVAYHEVGHALVAALLENTDPVHKITIVPRTMGALGYTLQLPTEDKYLISKEEMLDQIAVMLGGRAAEEVKFNQMSTGASNDIEKATSSARRMVTMYGMSERFDMMGLESASNRYLDGRAVMNCSEHTAKEIDDEVLKIIKTAHQKAIQLLKDNEELLNLISETLLEKETILGEEFKQIIENYNNPKPDIDEEISVDLAKEEVDEINLNAETESEKEDVSVETDFKNLNFEEDK